VGPEENGGKPVRLTHEDGPRSARRRQRRRPDHRLPGIPGGATNKYGDSPTLLIHLREDDALTTQKSAKPINQGSQWQNYVAYRRSAPAVQTLR